MALHVAHVEHVLRQNYYILLHSPTCGSHPSNLPIPPIPRGDRREGHERRFSTPERRVLELDGVRGAKRLPPPVRQPSDPAFPSKAKSPGFWGCPSGVTCFV